MPPRRQVVAVAPAPLVSALTPPRAWTTSISRSSSLAKSFRHLLAMRASLPLPALAPPVAQGCLWILGSLLGHAFASSIVTLGVMFCTTRGLLLFGRSPQNQSFPEFSIGVSMWCNTFLALVYLFIQSSVLATARFLVDPDLPSRLAILHAYGRRLVDAYHLLDDTRACVMASSAPRVPRHDFMWTHFHGWHVHPNGEDLPYKAGSVPKPKQLQDRAAANEISPQYQ